MLTESKLSILLDLCIWKMYIESKAKNRWHCVNFPKGLATAFTLAEVLITLLIVGVVVSLTIPIIIADFQKQLTVTRLQKVYSVLQQAVKQSQVENGNISSWTFPQSHLVGNDALQFANTYLIPYLSISKNCGTSSGCWINPKLLNGADFVDSRNIDTSGKYANFILNDGTSASISTLRNYAHTSYYYIEVFVDINGKSLPNIVGKDVFSFLIVPTGLDRYNTGEGDTVIGSKIGGVYPDGFGTSRNNLFAGNYAPWRGCSKTENSSTYVGTYCTALILRDNWQIKDDYPW